MEIIKEILGNPTVASNCPPSLLHKYLPIVASLSRMFGDENGTLQGHHDGLYMASLTGPQKFFIRFPPVA